jgi:subtilase family serine protease
MVLDQADGGWYQVGGTSAGAPQVAAMIVLADQLRGAAGSLDGVSQTLPALYSVSKADFHDITVGNNGYPAGPGYDLVTGRGSPVANLLVTDLANWNLPAVVSTSTTHTTTSTTSVSTTVHTTHAILTHGAVIGPLIEAPDWIDAYRGILGPGVLDSLLHHQHGN